jgi:hypothetical protein
MINLAEENCGAWDGKIQGFVRVWSLIMKSIAAGLLDHYGCPGPSRFLHISVEVGTNTFVRTCVCSMRDGPLRGAYAHARGAWEASGGKILSAEGGAKTYFDWKVGSRGPIGK